MTWNRRILESETEKGERYYSVHDVYYDDSGMPVGYAEDAPRLFGEDLTSLAWDVSTFRRALCEPVLSKRMFPQKVSPGLSRSALLRVDFALTLYRISRVFRRLGC